MRSFDPNNRRNSMETKPRRAACFARVHRLLEKCGEPRVLRDEPNNEGAVCGLEYDRVKAR